MPPRLRIRRWYREGRQVLKFEGKVDGSTACHALDVVARTPPEARELVLDLSAVTLVESFGLEVFSRGLRPLARARRVQIRGTRELLPALTVLAASLGGPATA